MVHLSKRTDRLLCGLFDSNDQPAAEELITTGCGDNLPGSELDTPESLDRIRFAALKISGGDMGQLKQAVELAQTDWRDLLMAAGFGHDTSAHCAWEISEVCNLWLAGERIDVAAVESAWREEEKLGFLVTLRDGRRLLLYYVLNEDLWSGALQE